MTAHPGLYKYGNHLTPGLRSSARDAVIYIGRAGHRALRIYRPNKEGSWSDQKFWDYCVAQRSRRRSRMIAKGDRSPKEE